VLACQDEMTAIANPSDCDMSDNAGVEVDADLFLKNAREHFAGDHEDDEAAQEFCPFCGLEDGDEITDPDSCTESWAPWALMG